MTFDEDDRPFEVFGWIGKTGSFGHGMTELGDVCLAVTFGLTLTTGRWWYAVDD